MNTRVAKLIPEGNQPLRLTDLTYHIHEVERALVPHYIERAQQMFMQYAYGLSKGEPVRHIAINVDLICGWGLNYEPEFMEHIGITQAEVQTILREEHLKFGKHCLEDCRKNPNSPLAAELWFHEAWNVTLQELGTTEEECFTFTNYIQTMVPYGKG